MKLFIFERVDDCGSGCYHPEGGIVVVAKDLEAAKLQVENIGGSLTEEELNDVSVYELANNNEEEIYVFPDAGCC